MSDILESLKEWFLSDTAHKVWIFAMAFAIGMVLSKIVSVILAHVFSARLQPGKVALVKRLLFYGMTFLTITLSLELAGIGMATLLGAAGIVTMAIGFASQTSASNFISGLFLMGERPFEIGDTIQIGNFLGEVISIDLLSVKIRTFDNLFVRVPNETMIKAETTNFTKYAIRRMSLPTRVAYGTDLKRVEALLRELAHEEPRCLDDPKPIFRLNGFGEDGLMLDFLVWCNQQIFFDLRTEMLIRIHQCFYSEGIEFAFPRRTLAWQKGQEPPEPTPPAEPSA